MVNISKEYSHYTDGETYRSLYTRCPFCGNEYEFSSSRTGFIGDYDGHHGGGYGDITKEQACTCHLKEKIEKVLSEIKPMCLNCKYHWGSYRDDEHRCTNKDNIAELGKATEMFDIDVKSVALRNPSAKCKRYELDIESLELNINPTGGEKAR